MNTKQEELIAKNSNKLFFVDDEKTETREKYCFSALQPVARAGRHFVHKIPKNDCIFVQKVI